MSPSEEMFLMDLVGKRAPEFQNIKAWINSEPLTIEALSGRVVFLDFWTYSCINCRRTIPMVRELHERYMKLGLLVIGIHAPEFQFERNLNNVKSAVERLRITYPVALDSENTTWKIYGNKFWPRHTLIDAKGRVVYEHAGEGEFDEIEDHIIANLSDAGMNVSKPERRSEEPAQRIIEGRKLTPEIYAGHLRSTGFGNTQACTPETCVNFFDTGVHDRDKVYLDGEWIQEAERIRHGNSGEGYVALKYTARSVNAVLGLESGSPYVVDILLDRKHLPKANAGTDVRFDETGRSYVVVDRSDCYELIRADRFETHDIKLLTSSPDMIVYAFTFG